ncbi:hypothetical protein Gotri_025252, partial [Gossypium trilobum]|nr:hypothetical protein [Gossypium trilobum]
MGRGTNQKKGESKCIPWKSFRDQILAHPDTKKKVDVFALNIYELFIFPKALGHIDEAVADLFDQLDRRVTPVPAILSETFRSLSACPRTGEGRFIGCAQLLLVWFHNHFWKVDKVSYQVFSENYSPLKELAVTQRRDDITGERWIMILQNLQDEDFEWKAHWMVLDEILSRQFIPVTQGPAECEFSYKCNNYKGKIREMSNTWKQIHQMKRITVGATTTLEYHGWRSKRINDNIPRPREERVRSIEKHLRVVPSELEIIKQDFEKRSSELGKKIEQLEEEKMHLALDVDILKLEAEKLRKGKNKAEEDLDSLKIDYKKLRLSIRTAGLGKTSEQWRQEIKEEKTK